ATWVVRLSIWPDSWLICPVSTPACAWAWESFCWVESSLSCRLWPGATAVAIPAAVAISAQASAGARWRATRRRSRFWGDPFMGNPARPGGVKRLPTGDGGQCEVSCRRLRLHGFGTSRGDVAARTRRRGQSRGYQESCLSPLRSGGSRLLLGAGAVGARAV